MTEANHSYAAFVREVRHALYYLYDPTALRRSALVQLFGLEPERGSMALQSTLSEAIGALKPDSTVAPGADSWRTYTILTHRFIDQFGQQEVAAGLGLSIRQMRRQESIALRALADALCARYDLNFSPTEQPATKAEPAVSGVVDEDIPDNRLELQWLERAYPSELTGLGEVIGSVLGLATPHLQRLQVQVHCALLDDLPSIAVQPTSLRQALLNVLTAMADAVPGGGIEIGAHERGRQVCISIRPAGRDTLSERWADSLDVARQLVGLSGGLLQVVAEAGGTAPAWVEVVVPAAAQCEILFIDDNADALQLFQRCLVGSRYLPVSAGDADQALALAELRTPRIIVLDVMLPGVDGWELLGRLRVHPKTRDLPIIVSTILPLEQFALTLGANAFLRKPVSQDDLLALLDRLLLPPSPDIP